MYDISNDINDDYIGRNTTKSNDSSLAKSIIDFESGFFAALTLIYI